MNERVPKKARATDLNWTRLMMPIRDSTARIGAVVELMKTKQNFGESVEESEMDGGAVSPEREGTGRYSSGRENNPSSVLYGNLRSFVVPRSPLMALSLFLCHF